jgi:hypothetical protein
MDWWRGEQPCEGEFRNTACREVLGAHKRFRPQGFYLQDGLLWMDMPQIDGLPVFIYDHYPIPVEVIKTGCAFSIRHVRTHSRYEFPLQPRGLEILPHAVTMPPSLCSLTPESPAWVDELNALLDGYLVSVPYDRPAYPYGDPRTGKDPSEE